MMRTIEIICDSSQKYILGYKDIDSHTIKLVETPTGEKVYLQRTKGFSSRILYTTQIIKGEEKCRIVEDLLKNGSVPVGTFFQKISIIERKAKLNTIKCR